MVKCIHRNGTASSIKAPKCADKGGWVVQLWEHICVLNKVFAYPHVFLVGWDPD